MGIKISFDGLLYCDKIALFYYLAIYNTFPYPQANKEKYYLAIYNTFPYSLVDK